MSRHESLGPIMMDLRGPAIDADEREMLLHPLVGGVILFTRNFVSVDQVAALCADIHALREPHLLIAVDHEGGRVQRFREGFTQVPAAGEVHRLYDHDPHSALALAEDFGFVMASEVRAVGIDISFAPVLDLDRGISKVIGNRGFHRDPEATAQLAHAYMRGMRRAGMEATVPMIARKGRASYLGERSAGHQDPGATSTVLLLESLADALRAES